MTDLLQKPSGRSRLFLFALATLVAALALVAVVVTVLFVAGSLVHHRGRSDVPERAASR